jgi:hypothetical protein
MVPRIRRVAHHSNVRSDRVLFVTFEATVIHSLVAGDRNVGSVNYVSDAGVLIAPYRL